MQSHPRPFARARLSVSDWLRFLALSCGRFVKSQPAKLATSGLLLLGLLAAYSRGPWIGAVFLYFVYAVLRPHPISGLMRAFWTGLLLAVIVALTPLRDKIVSVLPFMGGRIDYGNVIYRQQLLDRAWQIIQVSPMWGDQSALLKMQICGRDKASSTWSIPICRCCWPMGLSA